MRIQCKEVKSIIFILINLDASGNPVTETIQSVAVTDSSGNPVTGIDNLVFDWIIIAILLKSKK